MKKNFGNLGFGQLALVLVLGVVAILLVGKQAFVNVGSGEVEGLNTGFDKYGYNDTARIFNGTGESWSAAKGLPANYLGIYAKDKLVMKWNAEWDRGNKEGWNDPKGYNAWENNEWNGAFPGGSGAVWKYKIAWVGPCGADGTKLPNGGYCIWGQFETIMDQGKDPNLIEPIHQWFAHAKPAGYGAYK